MPKIVVVMEMNAPLDTGGSITIGEHRKRFAVEKDRDPTPSEIHLHVHTYGHDKKSFIGNWSRIVHEKYEELLQNQTQNQFEAYYQVVGGENKKRIYGLGSQAKSYYGSKLRTLLRMMRQLQQHLLMLN